MKKFLTLGPVFQSKLIKLENLPETQYFLIGKGKIRPCSEEDIVSQEYNIETEIPVEVETVGGAFYIETPDWYGSEGICRLTVNYFSLDTALRIFGELVSAFTKAESNWRAEADKAIAKEEAETKTEDFATALCNLLCEIENEGGGSESVSKARYQFETAARAAYEKEGGDTLKAVIEQFDIFADIG